MADFESAANAAVSTLEEVKTFATSASTEFTQASSKLTEMAADYKTLGAAVDHGLEALETQIAEAESKQSTRLNALQEEIAQVQQKATEMRDKLKQELEERETQASELDEQTEKLRDETKQLTESLVNEVDVSKAKLDEANDQLETDLGKVEAEIEAGHNMFDAIVKELNEQGDNFTRRITENCMAPITEKGNAISEQVMQLYSDFHDGLDEKTSTLKMEIGIMGQEAEKSVTHGWTELEEAIDVLEKELSTDPMIEIVAAAAVSLSSMNQAMEFNEKAYDELGQQFDQLVNVFRKMAD